MLLCSTGLGAGDQEEQQLLATLTSAGSPLHDKGVACRRLAVVGTPAAVPALARMLEDPSLAHFARIALEPMPFPEVDAALRDTMGRVQGRLLVGVVNTIGVRRDAGAIDAVEKLVTHDDAEVSDSAAAALGRIGTPATARILESALDRAAPARRNSIADAGLRCGEELLAKSQFDPAVHLFDAIAGAEIARHIQLGATRGSILARRDQGASLLVEQLRSRDPDAVALGLKVSRELPGTKVTETLAKELPKLPAERQALLATALGDRKDPAGRSALLLAARTGAMEVRVASVSALVSLADPSVLPVLLEAAGAPEPAVAQAAQAALLRLPEQPFDRLIVARLGSGDVPTRLAITELLAQRRAASADTALVQQARHADAAVRIASLKALGDTASPAAIPPLVAILAGTPSPQERAAADGAIAKAIARFDDKAACAPPLIAAFDQARPEVQMALLSRLGQAGGGPALELIRRQARSGGSAELRDTAHRALTDWPDPAALPDLWSMIEQPDPDHPVYRTLAFRGYVRLVRDSELPPEERLRRLESAMKEAANTDEKRLVLGALGSVRSADALAPARAHLSDPELAGEAATAVNRIVGQLDPARDREAAVAALEEVLKSIKDGDTLWEARRHLRQFRGQ
jgi:HEAT repeat protein